MIFLGVIYLAFSLRDLRKPTDRVFFEDILTPSIRSFMPDFSTKDLCTILFGYCQAACVEKPLFEQIIQRLIATNFESLNAADVAAVCKALDSMVSEHDVAVNSQVYTVVADQVSKIAPVMTPVQVSEVLFGLASFSLPSDHEVFDLLLEQASEKRSVYQGRNMVMMLEGLARKQYFPPEHVKLSP